MASPPSIRRRWQAPQAGRASRGRQRAPAESFLIRDGAPAEVRIVGSEGHYLIDRSGRRYVDFLTGWAAGNLGWGNREIREALRRSDRPDYVHPSYQYPPWDELAELLALITPGDLGRCVRATGGTEAMEIALQLAMSATRRHKFVSLEGSYHGNSIAAKSIGSSEYRSVYQNLLPNCRKLAPPLDATALGRVERLLRGRDVAAFIMEPIVSALGVLVPEKEFMEGLRGVCRKYGTLLIFDEITMGFGRTGKLFAAEHFDVVPDILCVAKALSGGYAGLGAAITTDKVARAASGRFEFYSTYGWHPVAVDAAIASIRYLRRYQERLLRNVLQAGAFFEARLSRMSFQQAPQIQAKGLAIGIRFARAAYATRIAERCREAGVLLAAEGDTLMLFPALTIDRQAAHQGLDTLEECL